MSTPALGWLGRQNRLRTGRLRLALSLLLLVWVVPTWPESPIDIYSFADRGQENRYKALIAEFRCPKCLNTNIAGSDAPIAQDLRKTVHRLLVGEGMSDEEIRDYLQARYGDFVLYNPPFTSRTWYIWMVPLGIFFVVLSLLLALGIKGKRSVAGQLSAQEQSRLDALMADHRESGRQ